MRRTKRMVCSRKVDTRQREKDEMETQKRENMTTEEREKEKKETTSDSYDIFIHILALLQVNTRWVGMRGDFRWDCFWIRF